MVLIYCNKKFATETKTYFQLENSLIKLNNLKSS